MKNFNLKKTLCFLTIFGVSLALFVQEAKSQASVKTKSTTTSSSPTKTILAFLKWYKNNGEGLEKITLLNMPEDNTIPYSVNIKGTEQYLATLKSTGFISEKYIQTWRKYFKEYEKSYKEDLQYEGCAAGFDYNFIMDSQDYDGDLDDFKKIKVMKQLINGNKADIKLKLPYSILNYTLTKTNNKWLIDEIKGEEEQEGAQ